MVGESNRRDRRRQTGPNRLRRGDSVEALDMSASKATADLVRRLTMGHSKKGRCLSPRINFDNRSSFSSSLCRSLRIACFPSALPFAAATAPSLPMGCRPSVSLDCCSNAARRLDLPAAGGSTSPSARTRPAPFGLAERATDESDAVSSWFARGLPLRGLGFLAKRRSPSPADLPGRVSPDGPAPG